MRKPGWIKAPVVALAGFGLVGCLFSVDTKNCGNDPSLCVVPNSTLVSGKVADGSVAYATVTLDTNDDRICEAGEPSTQTDANGNYAFAASLGSHMVCATGGTDIATGLPLVGVLMAPAGATQITPLTTLVMAQLNAASPPVTNKSAPIGEQDAFSAAAALASQLGITGIDNLLTADPVALSGSNPSLLQTGAALQVMMVQTVSLLQATGGDDTDEAGSPNTNALYADTSTVLGAILKTLPNPLSTGTLGSVAGSLLNTATSTAQADPNLAGLTGLADISPASVAAFAGPTLESMTNAVAGASTSSLLTANQYNLAALEQANVALANTTAALAQVLLTTTASIGDVPSSATAAVASPDGVTGSGNPFSTQVLNSIGSSALSFTKSGVPVAVGSGITNQAVQNNTGLSLSSEILEELANANVLNNVTQVTDVRINCGTAVCTPGALLDNQPLVSTLFSNGPFTNVIVSLAQPVGTAVKGGTASTQVQTGNAVGQAIAGTEQDSSVTIAISSLTPGSPQALTLTLDHIVLYQTNLTTSDGTAYVGLRGVIPQSAVLTVNGTSDNGDTFIAKLDGTAAGSVVQFGSLVSSTATSSDIKLDISALIVQLGHTTSNFPLLTDFNSNEPATGKSYVISTTLTGLKLSTLSKATPTRTRNFAVEVSF